MVFTNAIGCIHVSWVPAANPYRVEQIIVLFALLFALLAWRRVRPTPSWPVAVYMAASSLVTMSVTYMQMSPRTNASVEATSVIILQASAALAVSIYIEVARTVLQRRPAALANARLIDSCAHTRRNSSE